MKEIGLTSMDALVFLAAGVWHFFGFSYSKCMYVVQRREEVKVITLCAM